MRAYYTNTLQLTELNSLEGYIGYKAESVRFAFCDINAMQEHAPKYTEFKCGTTSNFHLNVQASSN